MGPNSTGGWFVAAKSCFGKAPISSDEKSACRGRGVPKPANGPPANRGQHSRLDVSCILGACPNICSCSRIAPGFAGPWPSRPRPKPVRALSPSTTAALQERRQIFRRLWVKQISCHSADTFSRPRKRNLRIPRADLIMPNTGSTICLRAAYRALPVAERSLLCIFSFTLASAEGAAASADGAAASAGTGASWCFCRPVAMCGSMPIFSNPSTASLLK